VNPMPDKEAFSWRPQPSFSAPWAVMVSKRRA
jgi:hypothetical protein